VNPAIYIPIIFLWILIFTNSQKKRKAVILSKIIENKKSGGRKEMKELATRFIDKECVIYSFNSDHQFTGTIKEVTDGAILIEKDGNVEAINLDFVIRIREFPKNKNGKKKSVILD
jgi:ferredoxin-fold anticodon binding domain-containing protein